MTRYVVIEGNTVVNAIIADEGFELPGFTLVANETADIGSNYDPETGEFTAAVVAQPVPAVVSRLQAKAALFQAGLLSQVEAAISEADPIVQMAWADAIEFRRQSPVILAMAGELNLSEAQVDDLFRAASLIEI